MLTANDVPHPVSLVVIDVAFISSAHSSSLPPFRCRGRHRGSRQAAVEAGRDEVGKHGIVSDPAVHDAVMNAYRSGARLGLPHRGRHRRSPARPATKFFLHLVPQAESIVVIGAGASAASTR
jgi:hypothetical protein